MIDVLVERAGATLKGAPRFIRAEAAEVRYGESAAVLARPRTFMNDAGQAVAPLVRYYRVSPDRLFVIHDDIDLPFAKLRVQVGRGPGGHNGVGSVAGSLGTRDFWRLKIGVGRPPGRQDPADYVLRRFAAKQRPDIDLALQYAADVVEIFVTDGAEPARQKAGELSAAE